MAARRRRPSAVERDDLAAAAVRQPASAGLERRLGGVEHGQHRQLGARELGVAVERERRLERGERELVDAHGAGERVAPARLDRLARADQQTALRPAQELVGAEAHDRRAGAHGSPDRRLVGQQLDVVGEHARADVVDDRDAEPAQRLDLDLLGEADGAEVRRVRAQDDAGALAQRRRVVAQPRAVRGADLDQQRAGLSDHLRDAKAAADLDELPARDDDLAPRPRQCRGGQEHGGGAVVDREPGLRAGHLAQQTLDVRVARAPLAGGEIELEVRVALGRRRHRGAGARRQRSAPEVRVHHHARGVEHAAQRGLEPLARPRDEVHVGGVPGQHLRTPLGELGPRHRRRQPVDRRQLAQSLAHARGRGLGHDFGWYDRRRARRRPRGALCAARRLLHHRGEGSKRRSRARAVVLNRACLGAQGARLP